MLYACYDLIPMHVVMEISWRHGLNDYTMPFMISYMSQQAATIAELKKDNDERKARDLGSEVVPLEGCHDGVVDRVIALGDRLIHRKRPLIRERCCAAPSRSGGDDECATIRRDPGLRGLRCCRRPDGYCGRPGMDGSGSNTL